jgi:chemotaxis protein MotC
LRRLAVLCALACALPAVAGEHGKEAPPVQPIVGPLTPFSDMMLDVQRIQARMAKGDKAAYGEQRARMKVAGAALAAAGPEAFKVRSERDAAVLYLLSGGQPRDIAKIAERGDFPASERDLLRGAAGYAQGRQADAEALLPYDPRAASLRLGSQLAYAQSVLLTPKDARKALDLLDLARLLAPGTLIEEAALRREILLVGDLRDSDRVAFLARQYVQRFGKSIYASDFAHSLSTATVRFDLCATLADLAKFSSLLELSAPEQSRTFLLTVARASALLARFDVASQAARQALKTAAAGSADEARAQLYDAVARFPEMTEAEAKAAFAAISQDKLDDADRDLLAAAGYIEARRYEPPPFSAYAETWREANVAAARSPDLSQGDDPAATAIRRAAAALAAAQTLGNKDIGR